MGYVHATIGLVNAFDEENARMALLDPEEIRKIEVEMLVDTGSLYMCINESIRSYLAPPVIGKKRLQLADGTWGVFDVVGR